MWPTSRRTPYNTVTKQGGNGVMSEHTVYGDHPHEHGPSCGHATVDHGDHSDYIHDGHTHCAHDDHYDERPLEHVAHSGHAHVHGEGCGHEAVSHGDHVDYVHDGLRHARHVGHYDAHCGQHWTREERDVLSRIRGSAPRSCRGAPPAH